MGGLSWVQNVRQSLEARAHRKEELGPGLADWILAAGAAALCITLVLASIAAGGNMLLKNNNLAVLCILP